MDGTILGQGFFTANSYGLTNPNPGVAAYGQAVPAIIQVPSAADWVKVYNLDGAGSVGTSGAYFNGTANAFIGTSFYWQRGMPTGYTVVQYKANTTSVLNEDVILTGGISVYDPSGQDFYSSPILGPAVATIESSNTTQPVVYTASTAGISVGTVVRMSNSYQTDVNGIDMVVSAVTTNTSFTLLTGTNALATAPGVLGGMGFYRIVNYPSLFYPRVRNITNITQATNAQVSTSIEHSLTAGQAVRFQIPAICGMTQLNGDSASNYFPQGLHISATVLTVVDAYNFTINVNTTSYSPFTYPTVAQQPSAFPTVVPFGENTAVALTSTQPQTPIYQGQPIWNANTGILSDSTINTGFLGLVLGAGGNGSALGTPILGPAGYNAWSSANVVTTASRMYWVAGKSTYGAL